MIVEDQPFLAVDRVRHQAEPIALVAHADRARLAEGMAHVKVRYEAEPAQLDFESASKVLKEIAIRRGDLDAVFARPGVRVVEGTYRTGAQEQLYIECNGVIAQPGAADPDDGGVTVHGSMQCPYYVVRALTASHRPAARQGARRADDHRRRLRRQGGVSVDARRPRRAARAQGRPRR